MPMVYDMPTERLQAGSSGEFTAPESKNVAAEQQQQQGQAMSNAAVAIGTAVQNYQNDVDTAFTQEQDNSLAEFNRSLLHDPETGYLASMGKTAVETRPDVVKSMQDRVKAIEGGLQNDVQRMMFRKAATQRMQATLTQIDSHAMNQGKIYRGIEIKAGIENSHNDALANYTGWKQPDSIFNKSKTQMLANTDALAETMGIAKGDEAYKDLIMSTTTKLHSEVLAGMIGKTGMAEQAREYFKDNEKEIDPSARGKLSETIDKVKTVSDADVLSQDIWAKYAPKDRNGAIPLFAMKQEARRLAGNDEEKQRMALQNIDQLANDFNAEAKEFRSQNTSAVWKEYDSGKRLSDIMKTPAWLELDGKEQHQIKEDILREQATIASRNASNSQKELAELQRRERLNFFKNGDLFLTATDPQVLSKMTRAEVEATRGKFGMDGTQHLLDKWEAIKNPKKMIEAKLDSDTFNNIALGMKLDPYSKNAKERAKVGTLKFRVEQALDIEQNSPARKGIPMTTQEKNTFLKNELSKKVIEHSSILGTTKEVPALSVSSKTKIFIDKKTRKNISDALSIQYKKTGNSMYAPTEKNLRREYLYSISPASAADFDGGF